MTLPRPGRNYRKPLVMAASVGFLAILGWYVNSYASLDALIAQELVV